MSVWDIMMLHQYYSRDGHFGGSFFVAFRELCTLLTVMRTCLVRRVTVATPPTGSDGIHNNLLVRDILRDRPCCICFVNGT